MSSEGAGEAAIIFARAMEMYTSGQHGRAAELFEQAVNLCECGEPQSTGAACVAAHIYLYKAHRALGHEPEAAEHFRKAVSRGANPARLRTP